MRYRHLQYSTSEREEVMGNVTLPTQGAVETAPLAHLPRARGATLLPIKQYQRRLAHQQSARFTRGWQ